MNARGLIIAVVFSIGLHGALFAWMPEGGPTASPPKAASMSYDESAALAGFEALDGARAVEAAMAEVVAQIPKVDFSNIKIPEAKPAPKPAKQVETKPVKKVSEAKPSKAEKAKAQIPGRASASAGGNGRKPSAKPSEAQLARAKANYNDAIRKAIANQRISLPRGARLNRVEVFLEFNNGRLARYGLNQSSGNQQVDKAVLHAVKTARYPDMSGAYQGPMKYVLPIQLQ